jgi:hypothetical protein
VLQWNKEKLEFRNFAWRPEKGHLIPEVKKDNELTCDYV